MSESDDPDAAAARLPAPDPHDAAAASPDDIFADFVRRANAEWVASVEAVLSELEEETEREREGTDRIVLLTNPKSRPPAPPDPAAAEGVSADVTVRTRPLRPPPERGEPARARPSEDWSTVVPQRSENTQRLEAAKLVPVVAAVRPPAAPAPEGSEDGLMPSGELDRKLADMDVLVRYGHVPQVQSELETLRLSYPHDLLLLRRIGELYLRHRLKGPAQEALFTLATGLFERRNVEGMRQALEQVLVLDPANGRAKRLLALLEQRPSSPPKAPPRR